VTRSRHVWALALVGSIAAVLVAVWSLQPERASSSREIDAEPRVELGPGSNHGETRRPSTLRGSSKRIRGRISDSDSGPLAEGRIDFYCLGSVYHVSTAVGEGGEFEAPACATGPTCVRLVHPGVEQPRGWELEPDTMVDLEVDAAPKITGVIVGPEGEIVPGAELLVQRGATRIASSSDAEGEFAVALPRARPCDRCDADDAESSCRREPSPDSESARLLVTAPRLAPVELELAIDEDAEVELAPAAPPIRGRVLGSDGEPFDERARVLAINRARDHERHAAAVDEHGRFMLEGLADAEYSLRVIRDERELATLALARPGDELSLRSDHAARGSTLILAIANADGEPIAEARVDGGPWRAAISDTEGVVEATAVLPGIYTVRVRADDCDVVREVLDLEPNVGEWLRRVQLPRSCR